MKTISFVIPCYRSEKTIEKVVQEIIETVSLKKEEYEYEVILVNDASPDNVFSVIEKMAKQNERIRIIDFAKNMGKHAAVLAGYSVAKGDYVVDLDDDYQCPTYEIWRLLQPLENDECDVAIAKYAEKKESFVKRFGSVINKKMTDVLLDKPRDVKFENFSVRKKYVCDEMVKYKKPYPFLEGLTLQVTHRIKTVEMQQRVRADDNATGFTLRKSISLLLNGLTAFSVKPLRIITVIGLLVILLGVINGVIGVVHTVSLKNNSDATYFLISVQLLMGGLNMVMLGLLGEYVGRTYISINDAPQYVVKRTINIKK